MKKIKTSLVLEGGGLRGAYTAGALAWLIDNNIEFDSAYAISVGAVYLADYLLKSKEYLYKFSTEGITDKRAIGLRAFLRCGKIVDYDLIFNDLMLSYGFDMELLREVKCDAKIGLYELEEGKTIFKNIQKMEYIELQAAPTLPIIGGVTTVNENRHILDGGISEMIPINQALIDGNDKFLVITTKPADFVRKPSKKIVVKAMEVCYPNCLNIARDYAVRDKNYYDQIGKVNKAVEENKAIHIRPSKTSNVSRLGGSKEELIELYNLGYSDMEANKASILKMFK